jgi:hypothetical protein
MKNIGINKPCSENWNEMSKNEQGAFCQKCASQVYDFTNKSSLEIKQSLHALIGQSVCGRITSKQEMELNEEFNLWMNRQNKHSFQSQLLFALLIVFGLGLFSCENQKDEQNLNEFQTSVARIIENNEALESTLVDSVSAEELIRFEPPVIVGMLVEEEIPIQEIIPNEKSEDYLCPPKEVLDIQIVGAMAFKYEFETFLEEEIQNSADELDENGIILPKKFEAKVFPNPAKEQTTFELAIPTTGYFEIQLLDLNGKILEVLHTGKLDKGWFRKQLNLLDLNTGLYLIVINSSDFKKSVRVSKI